MVDAKLKNFAGRKPYILIIKSMSILNQNFFNWHLHYLKKSLQIFIWDKQNYTPILRSRIVRPILYYDKTNFCLNHTEYSHY